MPALLHHNATLALIVMELLEPHIIMRKGLIAGTRYPRFASDITTFMARTLFFTSDLAMPAAEKKELIADFAGNTALCKITEDLIFTEPYAGRAEPVDAAVARRGRCRLPRRPRSAGRDLAPEAQVPERAEAMIHGDLHTGSIMVTDKRDARDRSRVRVLRPMGFDIGAVIANLLMSLSGFRRSRAIAGRAASVRGMGAGDGRRGVERVRPQVPRTVADQAEGDAYPQTLFEGEAGAARLEVERQAYMDRLFEDTVGFSAAKIIRRILGLAHNIDFELIEDPKRRAISEARSLRLARAMMVDTGSFPHHRQRHRDGARVARLASGFWQVG